MHRIEKIRRKFWIQTAVASLLFAASACAVTPEMQTFTSAEGRFTVKMPGTAQQREKTRQLNDGKTAYEHQFFVSLENNHVAYMLMYNDLSSGTPAGKPQEVFDRIRDGMAAGKTLVSDSVIQLNGTPGRAIVVRDGKGTLYQIHEFLVGGRLYQLIVSAESGYTADQVDAFMNSFRIL
jgi:hypothetical protein